jgi:ketosteroid isomerase-like protein
MMELDYADIVRQAYDLFSSDDAHGIPDLWTDDVTWHSRGSNVASGERAGAVGILAMFGDIMAVTQGTFQLEMQSVAVDGDRGFSLHKATAVTDEGVAEMWTVLGYRFRDGKIAEIWSFAFDQGLEDRVLS